MTVNLNRRKWSPQVARRCLHRSKLVNTSLCVSKVCRNLDRADGSSTSDAAPGKFLCLSWLCNNWRYRTALHRYTWPVGASCALGMAVTVGADMVAGRLVLGAGLATGRSYVSVIIGKLMSPFYKLPVCNIQFNASFLAQRCASSCYEPVWAERR